jgi:hypothetical protein
MSQWITKSQCRLGEMVCRGEERNRIDFYSNAQWVIFFSTKMYEWSYKGEERKQRAQQGLGARSQLPKYKR